MNNIFNKSGKSSLTSKKGRTFSEMNLFSRNKQKDATDMAIIEEEKMSKIKLDVNTTHKILHSAVVGRLHVDPNLEGESRQLNFVRHQDIRDSLVEIAQKLLDLLCKSAIIGEEDDFSDLLERTNGAVCTLIKGLYYHFFVIHTYKNITKELCEHVNKLEEYFNGRKQMKSLKISKSRQDVEVKAHRIDLERIIENTERINDENESKRNQLSISHAELIADLQVSKEELGQKKIAIDFLTGNLLSYPLLTAKGEGRLIGRGGLSTVYEYKIIKDEASKPELVAVKTFNDTDPRKWIVPLRILREAKCMKYAHSGEHHDRKYITQLLGVIDDSQERLPRLVLERADRDLWMYITSSIGPKPTLSDRLERTLEVAKGLRYLHSLDNKIMHGDLSSKNVLIFHGRARLADFGYAKVNDGISGYTTGTISYTIHYRAPEIIWRYHGKATEATDIYAFGSVFFEAMSGKRPFMDVIASDDAELEKKIREKDLRPDDTLPSLFSGQLFAESHKQLMNKCFQFHYDERPYATEVVHEIQNILLDFQTA